MHGKGLYFFLKEFDFLLNMGYKYNDISLNDRDTYIAYSSKNGVKIEFYFSEYLEVIIKKKTFIIKRSLKLTHELYYLYGEQDYTKIFPPENAIPHIAKFMKEHLMDLLKGKNWKRVSKGKLTSK